jgi:hypothetical protein
MQKVYNKIVIVGVLCSDTYICFILSLIHTLIYMPFDFFLVYCPLIKICIKIIKLILTNLVNMMIDFIYVLVYYPLLKFNKPVQTRHTIVKIGNSLIV